MMSSVRFLSRGAMAMASTLNLPGQVHVHASCYWSFCSSGKRTKEVRHGRGYGVKTSLETHTNNSF